MIRASLALLWASWFLLFASSSYTELASWLLLILIWFGVEVGTSMALIGRYIRSGSTGRRHGKWRAIEFTGTIMACAGWSLYFLLTVTQTIFVDDPVPAIYPLNEWGIAAPGRLTLCCLAAIMVCLTLERIFEISRVMGIEENNYKGKVKL